MTARKREPRPYQVMLIEGAWADLRAGKREVVLAGAPSAGKTFMAWELIGRAVAAGQRVLVLVHNQHFLKDQFAKDAPAGLDVFKVEGPEDVAASRHHRVVVAIPSSIRGKDIGHFDSVVVDEAHNLYHPKGWGDEQDGEQGMVQDTLRRAKVEQRLLLTGTPSVFVRRGLPLHAVSLFELLEGGFAADVRCELAASRFDFTAADYTTDGMNVKEAVAAAVTAEQAEATVGDMLDALVTRARAAAPLGRRVLRALRLGDYVGRGLVFCRGTAMADRVGAELVRRGVATAVSHSGNDTDSEEIERFKADDSVRVLVVADRCRVGFNLPELAWAADFTCTRDPDLQFQMVCRLARRHPDGHGKLFLKAAPLGMEHAMKAWLEAALNLGADHFYRTYDGTQAKLNGATVSRPRKAGEPKEREPGNGKPKRPRIELPVEGFFIQGWMADVKHRHDDVLAVTALTTLGEARAELDGYSGRLTHELIEERAWAVSRLKYQFDPKDPIPRSHDKVMFWCGKKEHRPEPKEITSVINSSGGCCQCSGNARNDWAQLEAKADIVGLWPVHGHDDVPPTNKQHWPYRCKAHGHVHSKKPNSVTTGKGCGECCGRLGQTHEKHAAAIDRWGVVKYLGKDDSVYKSRDRVPALCLTCHKEGEAMLHNLKRGRGLKCCISRKNRQRPTH